MNGIRPAAQKNQDFLFLPLPLLPVFLAHGHLSTLFAEYYFFFLILFVFGAMCFFPVKTTRVKLSVWLDEMNWTDTVVLKKLFYQITSEYPMVMVERTAQQSFTFFWSTETITTGLKVASINFTDFISCSSSLFCFLQKK